MSPEKKKSTLKTIFTPVMICVCGPSCSVPLCSPSKQKPEPKPTKRTSDTKSPVPLLSPSSRRYNPSPLYSFETNHDLGPRVSPRLLRSPCTKIDESVAVAKESMNPFEDFKSSMIQMIEERDIESEDDLKELLRCFLDINPPPQHNVIVRAFVDVCSSFHPQNDRHGRSLGRLLRLYVNPINDSHNARI